MSSPKTIVALCLVAAACTRPGHAREPEAGGSRLRIDLTYISASNVSESRFDGSVTVSDLTFGAGVTAQFPNGFYARARVSSTDTTEVELNELGFVDVFDPDVRHTTGTVGIGYRIGRDDGAFWGLGLRGSATEDDAATTTVSIFREKDTARRHGVIALDFASGGNELDSYSLTGRHVWFGSGSWIGPGVIWNATRGSFTRNPAFGIPDDVEFTSFGLGLVLMFRERP